VAVTHLTPTIPGPPALHLIGAGLSGAHSGLTRLTTQKSHESRTIALATLKRVNEAIAEDPNAILAITPQGSTPEAAYLSLVARLLDLGGVE
jgi:hypothetical protein